MFGAYFSEAIIVGGAIETGANVAGAIIGGAIVCGAIAGGANVGGANVAGAIIGGAIVAGANVGGATVGGANVAGANVSEHLSRSICRIFRSNCRRSICRRSICRVTVDSSPVQRFLGRRTKTKIPTTHSALKPMQHQSKHEMQQLMLNQKRQAHYFNRHSNTLSELDEGDVVRMKPFRLGDDKWKKATVIRRLDERSYEVMHHNQVYRRNREHLRSSRESPDVDSPVLLMPDPEPTPPRDGPGQGSTLQSRAVVTHESHSQPVCANPSEQPGRPADGQPFLRRSTRQRHEPKKLADYVKY